MPAVGIFADIPLREQRYLFEALLFFVIVKDSASSFAVLFHRESAYRAIRMLVNTVDGQKYHIIIFR